MSFLNCLPTGEIANVWLFEIAFLDVLQLCTLPEPGAEILIEIVWTWRLDENSLLKLLTTRVLSYFNSHS